MVSTAGFESGNPRSSLGKTSFEAFTGLPTALIFSGMTAAYLSISIA